MNDERETQFAVALLLLGTPAQLGRCLEFENKSDGIRYQSYRLFRTHKAKLLEHLEKADYFDVYYMVEVHGVRGSQLTEMCALWVGDFYQWILHQQNLQKFVTKESYTAV